MEGKCWAEIVKYIAVQQLNSKDISLLFNRFINENQYEMVEFFIKICNQHNKKMDISDTHSIIVNFMSKPNDLSEKYFKIFIMSNLNMDLVLIYQLSILSFNKSIFEYVRMYINFNMASIPKIINEIHTYSNYEERLNYLMGFDEIKNRMYELSLVQPLIIGNMKFVDFILKNKIDFNKKEIIENQFLKNLLMRDDVLEPTNV